MTISVKNLQTVLHADGDLRAYEIKGFSGTGVTTPKPPSLYSSAERKRYPYLNSRERYRNPSNLKPFQVDNWHPAAAHASKISAPLNTFVTVTWGATEYGDITAEAFQSSCKPLCQWLRDNGAPVAYIYVHENPTTVAGDAKPNTHLLLHVPSRLTRAFNAKLDDWFRAIMDGAVKSDPRTSRGYKGLDRLQYMAKGADYCTARQYGGYRKPGGQGIITFKRSGVSQSLNWKARDAFNAQYAHAGDRTFPLTKGGKP